MPRSVLRTASVALFTGAASISLGAATALSTRLTLVAGLGIALLLWLASAARLAPQFGRLWSRIRWWQFLWLVLFLSGFVLRARTTSAAAGNPLDAAGLYRVGLVAFVGLSLLALLSVRRIGATSFFATPVVGLLMIFNVVNLLSAAWSVYPAWTFYRSVEFTIDVAAVALIAANLRAPADYRRFFNWTWLLSGLLLLSVGIGAVVDPSQAIRRASGLLHFTIAGVFPSVSTNGVGELSALLAIVAVARLVTGSANRGFYVGLLMVSSGTLVVAQTRSAILPVVIAIPLLLVAARKSRWAISFVVAALGTLVATNASTTLWEYIQRGQTVQQFDTLSGRVGYWSYAWHLLKEHPWTGYGAFAGGRFEVAQGFSPDLSSTHGTIPEIAIGTSFWGVVPVLLCLCLVWVYLLRNAVRHLRAGSERSVEGAMTVESLGVLTLLTVRAFFSVELIWHPSINFLLLVGYVAFLQRQHRVESLTRIARGVDVERPRYASLRRPSTG